MSQEPKPVTGKATTATSQNVAKSSADSSGTNSNSSTTPTAQPAKLKSKKLDRTLAELETAFAAWDSISEDAKDAKPTPTPELKKRAESVDSKSQDQDFRTKTKKLLSQLRDQLKDLSDD